MDVSQVIVVRFSKLFFPIAIGLKVYLRVNIKRNIKRCRYFIKNNHDKKMYYIFPTLVGTLRMWVFLKPKTYYINKYLLYNILGILLHHIAAQRGKWTAWINKSRALVSIYMVQVERILMRVWKLLYPVFISCLDSSSSWLMTCCK